MDVFTAQLEGELLKRGFWIYVWQITSKDGKKVYYVGRTGDSSSCNAASPFSRLSAHLDIRRNARGNSMYRRLMEADISPVSARFKLCAYGPIFNEQANWDDHVKYRDQAAEIEYAVVKWLNSKGATVIGNHAKNRLREKLDPIFQDFVQHLEAKLL